MNIDIKDFPLLVGRYRTMMNRCYNPNHKSYNNYGLIGVTVSKEWKCKKNGLINYISWALSQMEYSQMKGLEIDKDLGSSKLNIFPAMYSKETCTFMTKLENSRLTKKKRRNNSSGYRGVHKDHGSKWTSEIRVDGKLIRLGQYTNPLDAAKAYDYFVKISNLTYTINEVLEDNEVIDYISIDGYTNKKQDTSSYHGVHFDASRNKWKAQLHIGNRKSIFIGRYKLEIEAHNAVQEYIKTTNLI
jgi:hypothetical protein